MSISDLPNLPVQTQTRTCKQCLRRLPMDRFRRVRDTQFRLKTCMECRVRTEKLRRSRLKGMEETSAIRDFERQLLEAKHEVVQEVVVSMVKKFGGPNELVAKWFEIQQQATPNRRLRSVEALLKLMAYHDASASERNADVERMDETEIEQEMEREVEKLIKHNPQIAVDAARGLGWTVVPENRKQN